MSDAVDTAVDLITKFEGFRPASYQDIVGVWTIGYGTTGPRVGPGQTISEPEARGMVQHTAEAIEKLLLGTLHVPVTDNQMAALISFAYNLGSSALLRSTLLKKLNNGDERGAAEEFVRFDADGKATGGWIMAGGKRVQGLINRRAAEKAVFLKDVPDTV